MSSLNIHSYNIAKFLVPLRPIASGAYMVNGSFSFVQEILNLNFDTDHVVMASFDITSLFTNVPLDETINLILDRLFHIDTHYRGFSCEEFNKLLYFSFENCHFIFNGCLYEQIDGIAMGSPLGPLFTDILSSHEKSWLDNCPSNFKSSYYRRYVNQLFFTFPFP